MCAPCGDPIPLGMGCPGAEKPLIEGRWGWKGALGGGGG